MPLQELNGIGSKIKRIGVPMIVKCILDPQKIKTYYEYPWGRIPVSTYHYLTNSEALRDDQDGHQSDDVKPENIEIINFEKDENYSKI